MKPYIISHASDIDGASPVIFLKMAVETADYQLVEVSDAHQAILDFIMTPENERYDQLYITDLPVSKEVCDAISSHPYWRSRTLIFDHHVSNLLVNEYEFATVIVEDQNGVKQCASTIFLDYLKKKYPEVFSHQTTVYEYVELVRLLDTWDWYEAGKTDAKQLGQLYDLYGKTVYIAHILNQLKILHHFYFTEFEEELLKIEERKIQEYMDKKKEEVWRMTIDGHTVGIVFAENYRSELGNYLSRLYQDQIDFFALVNVSGGISFRSCNDKVDLSIFAQKYHGGGHKRASGCAVEEEIKRKILGTLFPDGTQIEKVEGMII